MHYRLRGVVLPDDGPRYHRGRGELWYRNVHGHHHAYHRRVQAVWHGRPRQGHGTITSLEMVGGTVGAIVSGVLFDVTGSFASTWIVCLACSVVMLVFLLASEPIAAKLRASVAGE
ncbi:major facilitator superfamily domain-containing protein 7 [Collinsella sp. TF10-11AT]|uniref:major facilitator superfamily domain-containing protein 7 n=1 Tax=Collinsella sp. TF10-11AT TaxID=2292335 RepID=UPI0011C17A77|nr:major facilitator superfamily domain-containing protein 7 [Collinsella sp. TF10-11AT]